MADISIDGLTYYDASHLREPKVIIAFDNDGHVTRSANPIRFGPTAISAFRKLIGAQWFDDNVAVFRRAFQEPAYALYSTVKNIADAPSDASLLETFGKVKFFFLS